MRPIMNIFSPVSGWNADSYIFLALHTCSSVVPTGSFLCLLVKKKNNHTATVEYTSSKCNSSPQTLTSLLLPGGLFLKSPGTSFGPGKPFYVFHVYLQGEHFNRFENDQTELLANENKLTGFSARNHATR